MGTWGTDTFQNDSAADWVDGVEKSDDLSVVIDALERVVHSPPDCVKDNDGVEGLAACETVACLRGVPGERSAHAEGMYKWARKHAYFDTDRLVPIAIAAIDRIASAESELLQDWRDSATSEDFEAWKTCVASLRQRLESSMP